MSVYTCAVAITTHRHFTLTLVRPSNPKMLHQVILGNSANYSTTTLEVTGLCFDEFCLDFYVLNILPAIADLGR